MIIWRGWGLAVIVITFVVIVSVEYGVEFIFKSDNYYQANTWPLYLAAGIIATFIGILGYILNYKLRYSFIDRESGKSKKTPSHALFFIPIEFWAIIIPIFLIFIGNNIQQDRERERVYLQKPHNGDIYITDFSKIFPSIDNNYKYGVMKVQSMTSNEAKLLISNVTYKLSYTPQEDFRKNKTNDRKYFQEEMIILGFDEIQDYYNSGAIKNIMR